jgi:hypothetical protein
MWSLIGGWNHTLFIQFRGYPVCCPHCGLPTISNQLGDVLVRPPRDLRLACQPVHLSLSLGSAGQPVNDAVDYVAIRDDWLWSRSLSRPTVRNDSETKQLRYVSDLK